MLAALKVSAGAAKDEGPAGGGGRAAERDWLAYFDLEARVPEPSPWLVGSSAGGQHEAGRFGWIPEAMEGEVRERAGALEDMIRAAEVLSPRSPVPLQLECP